MKPCEHANTPRCLPCPEQHARKPPLGPAPAHLGGGAAHLLHLGPHILHPLGIRLLEAVLHCAEQANGNTQIFIHIRKWLATGMVWQAGGGRACKRAPAAPWLPQAGRCAKPGTHKLGTQCAPVTPFFLQKPSSAGVGAPVASNATCRRAGEGDGGAVTGARGASAPMQWTPSQAAVLGDCTNHSSGPASRPHLGVGAPDLLRTVALPRRQLVHHNRQPPRRALHCTGSIAGAGLAAGAIHGQQ